MQGQHNLKWWGILTLIVGLALLLIAAGAIPIGEEGGRFFYRPRVIWLCACLNRT